MPRPLAYLIVVLVLASCSSSATGDVGGADLPEVDAAVFEQRLTSLERPAVVNVWASWCIPCRSEAPLLANAYAAHGDEIEFIGVDVEDNQPDAKAFIAEFGIEFDQVFDRHRSVPNHYAGIGTPITFFFAPGGELVRTHNGIIDERDLALGIDELLHLQP
jgi:cytochrome c biogenesis protein CcmG/thiol:disulfide interchange protein DsbE